MSKKIKFKIDSAYNSLIKQNKVVGSSIAIVDNGEIVYATGYGFSDLANKTKANENTIYRIGSCSKSFTALGILQLQQQGKLNITEPITNHLTELQLRSRYNDSNNFIIEEMLSHTSGFPSDFWNGFFCDTPPDEKWVISQLNKTETAQPRKLNFAYSNIAYGVLGELIARKSNLKYEDYLSESIFKPLEMQSSFVYENAENSKNLSKAYLKGKEFNEPLIRDAAAGLIHSSALDMANYLKMFLDNGKFDGNSIIDSSLLQEMYKDRLEKTVLNSNIKYGLGLMIEDYFLSKEKDTVPVTIISHGGDTYAYHADFGFIPESKVGVVVLTNTETGPSMNDATKLLKFYLDFAYSQNLISSEKIETEKVDKIILENIANQQEIKGDFNLGQAILKVKNSTKIKFKQGPITLKLKSKDKELARYNLYAVLLGIPIKIKNQEFQFSKIEGKIYVRAVNSKKGQFQYIGVKSNEPTQLTSKWAEKLGSYSSTNDVYKCEGCTMMNMESATLNIAFKNNYFVVELKGKSSDSKSKMYFDCLDETTLSCGGIGRGMTEKIKVLENGNLFYQGFEFKKN
ncbi:MAG: class A beta-lactamase-related serine hydrolase [Crocinitomicaceae bacterium]|nr:class A beta-lactamase-related serine hydrolase [Crocinitomicaceae bacterium]